MTNRISFGRSRNRKGACNRPIAAVVNPGCCFGDLRFVIVSIEGVAFASDASAEHVRAHQRAVSPRYTLIQAHSLLVFAINTNHNKHHLCKCTRRSRVSQPHSLTQNRTMAPLCSLDQRLKGASAPHTSATAVIAASNAHLLPCLATAIDTSDNHNSTRAHHR